jgi:hypothetical protein
VASECAGIRFRRKGVSSHALSRSAWYFKRAAETGRADAQFAIGRVHLTGRGAMFDLGEAAHDLATLYIEGRVDGRQDFGEAAPLASPAPARSATAWPGSSTRSSSPDRRRCGASSRDASGR